MILNVFIFKIFFSMTWIYLGQVVNVKVSFILNDMCCNFIRCNVFYCRVLLFKKKKKMMIEGDIEGYRLVQRNFLKDLVMGWS